MKKLLLLLLLTLFSTAGYSASYYELYWSWFIWEYALIGYMIGFIGLMFHGSKMTYLFGISAIGFLIFSATLGFGAFFLGLAYIMVGALFGIGTGASFGLDDED